MIIISDEYLIKTIDKIFDLDFKKTKNSRYEIPYLIFYYIADTYITFKIYINIYINVDLVKCKINV